MYYDKIQNKFLHVHSRILMHVMKGSPPEGSNVWRGFISIKFGNLLASSLRSMPKRACCFLECKGGVCVAIVIVLWLVGVFCLGVCGLGRWN